MSLLNSVCLQCTKKFYARPTYIKRGWGKFCSQKCQGKHRTTSKHLSCANCKKDVIRTLSAIKNSITGNVFCSRKCATIINNKNFKSWLRHPNYINGNRTYRRQAIKFYGLNCNNKELCPLNGLNLPIFMYEVDHIDGNHKNNYPNNWQVLCVWCHRQKTYKLLSVV